MHYVNDVDTFEISFTLKLQESFLFLGELLKNGVLLQKIYATLRACARTQHLGRVGFRYELLIDHIDVIDVSLFFLDDLPMIILLRLLLTRDLLGHE